MWSRVSSLMVIAACVGTLSACSADPEVLKKSYVKSGDGYMAEKKYPEAIIEYKNAVNQDVRFGEARLKLAKAYLEAGDLVNGYREHVRAADLLPNDPDAQVATGELLLMARKFEDAKSRADKVLEKNPNNVPAQILRANALAGLNRVDDAIKEVEEAIRADPDRSASYASLGIIQMSRGGVGGDEAEKAFRKAISTDDKSFRAKLALAYFLWSRNRLAEAETELRAAVQLAPEDVITNQSLAYYLLSVRRPAEAEPFLKVVADKSPGPRGKFALADYYASRADREKARVLLEEVAKDPKVFADATLRLATLGYAAGDTAKAEKLVDQVLAKQPNNGDALTAKSQLLLMKGDMEGALTTAKTALASSPNSVRAYAALGRIHTAREEPDDALRAYTEALRLNPRFAVAEVEIAKLHLRAGRLDLAEQFAESAIRKVGGFVDAHLVLARINVAKGQPAKAEPSLRILAKALPDVPGVQFEIAQLELAKGNRAAAREAFERVLTKAPNHVDALAGLVKLDLIEKKPAAAAARIDAALARSPKDAGLLNLSGSYKDAMGDRVGAEAQLRAAIEADPNLMDGYLYLARMFMAQGRLNEARSEYERLALKRPTSIAIPTVIAILYHMENKLPEAQAKYEAILKINERAAVAANNLAFIYAEQGEKLDIALQLAQTAKSQMPDRHEVNDTLGWILVKKGMASSAVAPMLQAVAKEPNNPTYQYHLGMAYVGVGQNAKARAALDKALTIDPKFSESAEARKALAGLKG